MVDLGSALKLLRTVICLTVGAMLSACGDTESQQRIDPGQTALGNCDPALIQRQGPVTRLALIVGVAKYQATRVTNLFGPTNDAQQMYRLLTDPNGYGFLSQNVCVLLDAQATSAAVTRALQEFLTDGISSPQDVALFYFAGHGSQRSDKNGDEPDGFDETLMFYDARTPGIRDYSDDQLHEQLKRLHAKTQQITVILDSCNSGTAMRDPTRSTARARFFENEADTGAITAAEPTGSGDGAGQWGTPSTNSALTGLVVLSGAADGAPAIEKDSYGVFTKALVQTLMEARDNPPTYAQLARLLPPLIAAESDQVAYFHGNLDRPVFSSAARPRPIAWEVSGLGPPLSITGPPLPGFGTGAELRLYAGNAQVADSRNPARRKARVRVTQFDGLTAEVEVLGTVPSNGTIELGDLAVLQRPSDAYARLRVHLAPASQPNGLSTAQITRLRALQEDDPETQRLIELTDGPGDFEVGVTASGFTISGPEAAIRSTHQSAATVLRTLWLHARQRALLTLHGEGGNAFRDQQSLLARLVPAASEAQQSCSDTAWNQAAANAEQAVPECHRYHLEVSLAADAPSELLINALLLSNDGSIYALPVDNRRVQLRPGETLVFNEPGERLFGMPPHRVRDHFLVFGTRPGNPVNWTGYAELASTRSAMPPANSLQAELDRYLIRSDAPIANPDAAEEPPANHLWTLSTLTATVVP